jgi:hypothetical protein
VPAPLLSLPCFDSTFAVESQPAQCMRPCSACRALTPPSPWGHSMPSTCADAQLAMPRCHPGRAVAAYPAPLLSLPCSDSTFGVGSQPAQCMRRCSACCASTPPLPWGYSMPGARAVAQPAVPRRHLCRGIAVCPVPAPLLRFGMPRHHPGCRIATAATIAVGIDAA